MKSLKIFDLKSFLKRNYSIFHLNFLFFLKIDLKRLQDINKSTNLMQDQIQEVESKSHLTRKEIEESISLSDTGQFTLIKLTL